MGAVGASETLPLSLVELPLIFCTACLSAQIVVDCSIGRIISDLGFSLGTNNASAFGVAGEASSSLKNGTLSLSLFG